MTIELLPDDVPAAEEIVRLKNENAWLRRSLIATAQDRAYWRRRAMRWDADYQEGLGEYELGARQDREEARRGR